MRQLVFVHGRAQEFKDAAALEAEWIAALTRGLGKSGLSLPIAESDVRFPYYGQALNDLIAGSEGPAADVIVKGATTGDRQHEALARAIVEEVRKAMGIADAEVTAELDASLVQKGALNWGWVQAGLRVIDRHVPGSGVSLALFTYDVAQYLANIGLRDTIETGVRSALTPGASAVVVGHSLGTVVSYSLLAREGRAQGWDVPLYVTLGSPLAVTAIKRRLAPIAHPACVARWLNVRDARDVVALYPLDEDHFPVEPPITNASDVVNHTANRHGIAGYLDDANVARAIHDALTA